MGAGYGGYNGDPVWAWYVGIESFILGPVGLVLEYRGGQVESRDRFHKIHEIGFGGAWSIWG